MSPLRPLGSNVVVKLIPHPKVSDGGIDLPDTAALPPQEGIIQAIGLGELREDGTRRPMTVEVGQKVLFLHFAGQQITLEGEDYIVLSEEDIVGMDVVSA